MLQQTNSHIPYFGNICKLKLKSSRLHPNPSTCCYHSNIFARQVLSGSSKTPNLTCRIQLLHTWYLYLLWVKESTGTYFRCTVCCKMSFLNSLTPGLKWEDAWECCSSLLQEQEQMEVCAWCGQTWNTVFVSNK